MASSRDDFVIAIRSAFLKKSYQQKFSLLNINIFISYNFILGSFNFKPIQYIKIGINEVVYRSSFISFYSRKLYKKIKSSIERSFKSL
jgi:rod shape-determining protein MreC